MRRAGEVTYANAHKDRRNEGYVIYGIFTLSIVIHILHSSSKKISIGLEHVYLTAV